MDDFESKKKHNEKSKWAMRNAPNNLSPDRERELEKHYDSDHLSSRHFCYSSIHLLPCVSAYLIQLLTTPLLI